MSGETHYEIDVKCVNCGDSNQYEIPFGTLAKDWFNPEKNKHAPKCEACGCTPVFL